MDDRELDALVAEKVMGWCWQTYSGYRWFAPESDLGVRKRWHNSQLVDIEIRRADRPADEYETEEPWWLEGETRTSGPAFKEHVEMHHVVPHYSTSIADAFLVVEEMRRRGWYSCITFKLCGRTVAEEQMQYEVEFRQAREPWGRADDRDPSPARAICLAALRALGVEVQP